MKRGCFQRPESNIYAVPKLLTFFRVGSVDAWTARYGLANVAYRHSPKFKSSEFALATWLRLGEIEAEREECADFSESRFGHAIGKVRGLTREPIVEALQQTAKLCNEAGVALVVGAAIAEDGAQRRGLVANAQEGCHSTDRSTQVR